MAVKRALIREVRAALKSVAVKADAAPMQAYMKSEMPYYGVKKPARVAALKPVFEARPITEWEDLRDTTLELWRKAKFREERYAALDLTRRRQHKGHLTMRAMPMYEEMIVSGAWWDYVDEIAAHRVGAILESDLKKMHKLMRKWSTDKDMWKRRTSILCQLKLKDRLDTKLLVDCMKPSMESKEFFLRKAIGWALRSHSYVDPDWVIAYVNKHANVLSGLSKREGFKALMRNGVVKAIP